MATIKTKFRVVSINEHENDTKMVVLEPVTTAPENEELWKTTPTGSINLPNLYLGSDAAIAFKTKAIVNVTFETE